MDLNHINDQIIEVRDTEKTIRILDEPPFYYSKYYASRYNCHLSIPNNPGIGNVLAFTPLISAFSRKIGNRIRILTAPFSPITGKLYNEIDYPIFLNNPYIEEIINSDDIDRNIIQKINREQDNYCHFNNIIKNICYYYNVIPSQEHPELYLSFEEKVNALERLTDFKRPIICIHPGGTSSSTIENPWFLKKWKKLIDSFSGNVTFVQVSLKDFDEKPLKTENFTTTLREAFSLIWASDYFIGFDSGMAHVATAFRKKSIVIWDVERKSFIEERHQAGFAPLSMIRWSYPQNVNLITLGEKDDEIIDICQQYINKWTLF